MNTTRTWTHAVITAAFAITAATMSFSVVLAETKDEDSAEKTCLDKLHAKGLACSRDHRACLSENTSEAQLYCDNEKDSCETRAQNSYRACEKAMVQGTVGPAIGKGDTGGVLVEPSPSAPDTKGGTVAPSPYGTRKGTTP
jgi:hypothetical protein